MPRCRSCLYGALSLLRVRGRAVALRLYGSSRRRDPRAVGRYSALCLNSDTENVTYRNTDQKTTFEVSSRTTDLLSGLSALGVRSDGVPRADGTEPSVWRYPRMSFGAIVRRGSC